ncbi:hypothetical protein DL546_007688 [Coniochaeta pulveracea]|uniref:Uncharacterized protein n=1 Tax=Coniochaeta pulveracea TaxID=177199 RepID=A0A420YBT0_9PEZI|nr:hypothetical protein DL546_007688 [Coniochaeta pulveracea]
MGDILPEAVPQAPISELLTLVITTSPTPSAPTTDLISSVLQSFGTYCPGLLACRVIVVFDTFDRIGPKNRLKKGTVTEEGARIYEEYKSNVKQLILSIHPSTSSSPLTSIPLTSKEDKAEYGLHEQPIYHVPLSITSTPDGTITFIEPTQRLGFGLGVRTALRTASTPYVWIHQHDWTLISPIPLNPLLTVLSQSTPSLPVQYICFPSVRMLRYAVSDHVTHFPALRAITNRYKRTFTFPPSNEEVPLTPLFFWHDKPHIAAREHYLDRIFPSRLAIGRGEFIEDRVGQRARDQMKKGIWERWACWLYYPDDGRELVVRHLNGRIWKGQEEDERRREWRAGREGEEPLEQDGEVEGLEEGGDQ